MGMTEVTATNAGPPSAGALGMKLEVVVIPVSDVDRFDGGADVSDRFYAEYMVREQAGNELPT